jgi:hypothetical protein
MRAHCDSDSEAGLGLEWEWMGAWAVLDQEYSAYTVEYSRSTSYGAPSLRVDGDGRPQVQDGGQGTLVGEYRRLIKRLAVGAVHWSQRL